jgi:hypothetical protein
MFMNDYVLLCHHKFDLVVLKIQFLVVQKFN